MTERYTRNAQRGMSIIELLVSIIIIGVAIAGLTETLWFNALWSYRLGNKLDNIYAARQFLNRVSKDLRMASNVGDEMVVSDQFPTSTEGLPSDNYYNYATTWSGAPFKLSNQQLIIQIPVFDSSGFPSMVWTQGGTIISPAPTGPLPAPGGPQPTPNVDTVCYQVVADPDPHAPGPFMLQMAVFPAVPPPPYVQSTRPAIVTPQTILRGVTGPGPLDPTTGLPNVFEYIDQAKMTTALSSGPQPPAASSYTVDTPVAAEIVQISAVRINLEIRHETFGTTNASGGQQQAAMMGFQSTVFLRNHIAGSN